MDELHRLMAPIRLRRVETALVPQQGWRRSPWPGVALRGAFGQALYDELCNQSHRECSSCPERFRCAVPRWFDPGLLGDQSAAGYAMQLHSSQGPMGALRLRLALYGPAPSPARLHLALKRMAEVGLGPERCPHHLGPLWISGEGEAVCAEGQGWPEPVPLARLLPAPRAARGLTVRFSSPWSLPRSMQPDGAEAEALLMSCWFRLFAVARLCADEPISRPFWAPRHPLPRVVDGALQLHRGQRHSRRSGGNMELEGWTGWLRLEGELEPWQTLLEAGALLQIGRRSSHGLGALTLHWD